MTEYVNLLEILTVGGRITDERSHAAPTTHYFDPIKIIKFNRGAMEKTKAIEQILYYEIQNWIRWGRRRDWLPVSFRVPLGFLFKSSEVHDDSQKRPLTTDEIGAAAFEKIIVSLPKKHRQAFVLFHLEKAVVSGRIIRTNGRKNASQLLGVQVRQYHYIVNQAHSMVLRECKRHRPELENDD